MDCKANKEEAEEIVKVTTDKYVGSTDHTLPFFYKSDVK